MDAGAMDREIVLQTATVTQDASTGEEVRTWASETVWAQWLPAGTREAWQAQRRLESYVDGVFRIYDRSPRPTPDRHRIVMDGRTFDLKPYVELERGEGLEIPATAKGSE